MARCFQSIFFRMGEARINFAGYTFQFFNKSLASNMSTTIISSPLQHQTITQKSCLSTKPSYDYSCVFERRSTAHVFDLEVLDTDLYKGTDLWNPPFTRDAIYGGHLTGQCLVAACKTVPEALNLHSMHSYFIRPGDLHSPVIYRVSRNKDGISFSSRTVTAFQKERPILILQASFHNESNEPACHVEYRPEMPDYKHHLELETPIHLFKALDGFSPELPIEIKYIEPEVILRLKKNDDNKLAFWLKSVEELCKCSQITT